MQYQKSENDTSKIFGIHGPNGAGKSTIVIILNTLVKPGSGEVIIGDVNIKDDQEQDVEVVSY